MLEVRSLTTDLGQIYSLFHSSRVIERSTKHAQVSKLRGFYDKLTTWLTHMPYRVPQAWKRKMDTAGQVWGSIYGSSWGGFIYIYMHIILRCLVLGKISRTIFIFATSKQKNIKILWFLFRLNSLFSSLILKFD